ARNSESKPYTVILGGAKLSTKVELIKKILKKCDHFLFGGKVANILLRIKGLSIGKLIPEGDEDVQKSAKEINLTNPKIHLPTDVVVGLILPPEEIKRESGPGNVRKKEAVLDIGPETVSMFGEIIKESKIILWNGPLGYFEKKEFAEGTKEIADIILENKDALKIVGGGDTVYALGKFGLRDKFDHVSTGGGAMLSYIAGEDLPGIEALKEN
ncbi:MAG: phosphoglycerate kinase, partial [Minisyncoccales bacterium]